MRLISFISVLSFVYVLTGCNATKHLPEDEVLYIGPKIFDIQSKKEDSKKIKIKEKTSKRVLVWMETLENPNGAFMGIPFLRFLPVRVYFYNWFYTEKEQGFRYWMMENFGEPPTSISKVNPPVRVARAKAELFKLGHLDVDASYEVKYRPSGRRAKIKYHFALGHMYRIKDFEILGSGKNPELDQLLLEYRQYSTMGEGSDFNIYQIEEDRNSLVHWLRDKGYFYLNQSSIRILADTNAPGPYVRLRYELLPELPASSLQKATLNSVNFTLKTFNGVEQFEITNIDSSSSSFELRPEFIDMAIAAKSNEAFQETKENRSLENLYSTAVFRKLNIEYEPAKEDSTNLTALYSGEMANKTSLAFEGAVSTKSSHFIGPSIGIKLGQKNLFGGAENLSYGLDAFYDFPTGILRQSATRSTGMGLFANLSYPVERKHFGLIKKANQGLPKGVLSLRTDFNNRTDYFRLINVNASYGLQWHTGRYVSHKFNYVVVNYNNLLQTTPEFDSLLDENIQVKRSFEDQFFIGPAYSFLYNSTRDQKLRNRFYFRARAEFSGNLLNGIQSAFSSGDTEKKEFIGLPYAQFIILSTDFRYYRHFGPDHQLILRLAPAVGISMGNSENLPYVKQFYVGGNSSLRPISARSLGPGLYLPTSGQIASNDFVISNSGDLLLEGNFEYRFNLIYKLKAALWSDFGNVFLLRDDPQRPGGQFDPAKGISQFVVTSGIGLRLDFDFLVLRWDIGTLLHYPWFENGQRWTWQNDVNLWGGVIAIGYPF